MSDPMSVNCDSCGLAPFKYRCPGCSRLSCSVSCIQLHKVKFGCSGLRCKTEFVPLNQFSNNLLYSDYYFLEDVGRCVDSAHRSRVHKKLELGEGRGRLQRFHWLKTQALHRDIKLHLLPEGMSRHRVNTSCTVRASGNRQRTKQWEINWCLQLQFPQADMEFHEDNVSETMLLSELLDKYLHPSSSDPIARHQLRVYVRSRSEVEVLMKNNDQTAANKYCRLDQRVTLLENFIGKTIIEYPQLTVVLRTKLEDYGSPFAVVKEAADTLAPPDDTNTPTPHISTSLSTNSDTQKDKSYALTLIAQGYSSDSCGASDGECCM